MFRVEIKEITDIGNPPTERVVLIQEVEHLDLIAVIAAINKVKRAHRKKKEQ